MPGAGRFAGPTAGRADPPAAGPNPPPPGRLGILGRVMPGDNWAGRLAAGDGRADGTLAGRLTVGAFGADGREKLAGDGRAAGAGRWKLAGRDALGPTLGRDI